MPVMELQAPADGPCPGGPCWKTRPGRYYRYRDAPDKTPDGVKGMVLRTLPEAFADIVLRASGPNVPVRRCPSPSR